MKPMTEEPADVLPPDSGGDQQARKPAPQSRGLVVGQASCLPTEFAADGRFAQGDRGVGMICADILGARARLSPGNTALVEVATGQTLHLRRTRWAGGSLRADVALRPRPPARGPGWGSSPATASSSSMRSLPPPRAAWCWFRSTPVSPRTNSVSSSATRDSRRSCTTTTTGRRCVVSARASRSITGSPSTNPMTPSIRTTPISS